MPIQEYLDIGQGNKLQLEVRVESPYRYPLGVAEYWGLQPVDAHRPLPFALDGA